jgi:hypothetical protein
MKRWGPLALYFWLIGVVLVSNPVAQTTAPNPNCTLIVPVDALSAQGLATPYQLLATDSTAGECHEANTSQSAFVQAAILDPATGQISVYNPLVMDEGAVPAVAPVLPTLPANAVVAIWFGYNGDVLTLQGQQNDTLAAAGCVNGLTNSNFGQFAYCNAPILFTAAKRAIRRGQLKVPPLGVAADGRACPSVRDFFVVDQDQSDNLPTTYLITNMGMAQFTQANLASFPGATPLGNPSDNRLVDQFLDGALACTPWKVPDLADPGQMVPALPLNELQARAYQRSPVALVPLGDPMALNHGAPDLAKVNAYRAGVDQPQAGFAYQASTTRYCRQMVRIAPARLLLDQPFLMPSATNPNQGLSPDPAAANSLFTFMAQRFIASYDILGCAALLQLPDPVSVTTDTQGVATAATINPAVYGNCKRSLSPTEAQDNAADDAARAFAMTP